MRMDMANLSGSSRGGGDAEEPTALASHVERLVDGFLNVAAGFGQHFAHLAGHFSRVFFLVLDEDIAGAEKDLGSLGRGDEPPGGEGVLCGGYSLGDVLGMRGGERANNVGVVSGVEVEDGFAARGREPLAADQVVVDGIGHEDLVWRESWFVNRGSG